VSTGRASARAPLTRPALGAQACRAAPKGTRSRALSRLPVRIAGAIAGLAGVVVGLCSRARALSAVCALPAWRTFVPSFAQLGPLSRLCASGGRGRIHRRGEYGAVTTRAPAIVRRPGGVEASANAACRRTGHVFCYAKARSQQGVRQSAPDGRTAPVVVRQADVHASLWQFQSPHEGLESRIRVQRPERRACRTLALEVREKEDAIGVRLLQPIDRFLVLT
jgi:hypothetical protein